MYRFLADATVLLHCGFVIFVVAGGLLVILRPKVAWVHIPAVIWGILIEFAGWICPLTYLENWFRHKGGQADYPGGFIDRYLLPFLYPDELSRSLQLIMGTLLAIINLLAYAFAVNHRRKRHHGPTPGPDAGSQ